MKKALALVLTLVMLLSLSPMAFAAQKNEINIFMWSDYISDELIENFEKEFDVRVNLSYMNDNADSITKLTAGAGSEYDLISPTPPTSTRPTGPSRIRSTACPIS